MPCWVCKGAIIVVVIALAILLAKVAVVSAAVINAIQAIILAAELVGLSLSPLVVSGSLGILAGFSITELAEWLCCKMGVTACC